MGVGGGVNFGSLLALYCQFCQSDEFVDPFMSNASYTACSRRTGQQQDKGLVTLTLINLQTWQPLNIFCTSKTSAHTHEPLWKPNVTDFIQFPCKKDLHFTWRVKKKPKGVWLVENKMFHALLYTLDLRNTVLRCLLILFLHILAPACFSEGQRNKG